MMRTESEIRQMAQEIDAAWDKDPDDEQLDGLHTLIWWVLGDKEESEVAEMLDISYDDSDDS